MDIHRYSFLYTNKPAFECAFFGIRDFQALRWQIKGKASSKMLNLHKKVQRIDNKTQSLINGYIREYQHNVFGALVNVNTYYTIPELVNNHCMMFYDPLRWYTKKVGPGIEFISERIVKKSVCDNGWSTCVLGYKISKDLCNKFDITFRLNSFGSTDEDDYNYPYFYLGFVTGKSIKKSIKKWNQAIGHGSNTATRGWCISINKIYSVGFFNSGILDRDGKRCQFAVGDIFRISFDFEYKQVALFYNDQQVDLRKLKTKKLWIALSFALKNEIIEIIDYLRE